MELSLLLIDQIVIQFIMIFVGWFLIRIKLTDEHGTTALSKLVLYVIMPCSILNSFQIEVNPILLKLLGIALAVAVVLNILFLLMSYLLKRTMSLDEVEQASITYPNCSNLIIPLVAATLGEEWTIFCCPYILVQNCIFFTIGIANIRGERKLKLKQSLSNINTIVIFIGIILLITQIRLPVMVSSVIDSFGRMIAPASMMVIGMSIGKADFIRAFTDFRNYVLCFFRLIVMPFLAIVLIKVSGIGNISDQMKTVLMIVLMGAASSSAAMITQTARCYGKDSEKASVLNMMSVLFLIVTMPLIITIYEHVI